MKTFLSPAFFLATVLLTGCASEPVSTAQAETNAACRRTDAPTGSNLVRKSECAPVKADAKK